MRRNKRYFCISILLIMTMLTGCLGNSSSNTNASSIGEEAVEVTNELQGEETEQNNQVKDLGEDVKSYREKRVKDTANSYYDAEDGLIVWKNKAMKCSWGDAGCLLYEVKNKKNKLVLGDMKTIPWKYPSGYSKDEWEVEGENKSQVFVDSKDNIYSIVELCNTYLETPEFIVKINKKGKVCKSIYLDKFIDMEQYPNALSHSTSILGVRKNIVYLGISIRVEEENDYGSYDSYTKYSLIYGVNMKNGKLVFSKDYSDMTVKMVYKKYLIGFDEAGEGIARETNYDYLVVEDLKGNRINEIPIPVEENNSIRSSLKEEYMGDVVFDIKNDTIILANVFGVFQAKLTDGEFQQILSYNECSIVSDIGRDDRGEQYLGHPSVIKAASEKEFYIGGFKVLRNGQGKWLEDSLYQYRRKS